MQIKTVLTTTSLILVAASAAACSSGSTAASPTSPASAAGAAGAASSSAATAGTAGAGAPKNFDVCAALPATAASQITGTTFTKTKSDSVQGVIFSCEYDGPSSALLQITVDTQDGQDEIGIDLSALKTVGHPPTAISGVGDKAFSEPDPKGNAGSAGASSFASYGAVFGADYIKIGGLTYVTAAQGKQIVEQLHSKL